MSDKTLVKRNVTIKSQVTDEFREKAQSELTDEVATIDNQLKSLESQYQQSLQQLEDLARQGHNVARQMDQLHQDARSKQQQLQTLKAEVSKQLANLDKVSNGDYVITGQLENFIEVSVGDNIYEKIRGAEILLKDGIVTAILG